MIKIKAPLQLKSLVSITNLAELVEGFANRIMANYGFLSAGIRKEELLHLLLSEPEQLNESPYITRLVENVAVLNQNEITLNIINQLINRIITTDIKNFTYQDNVYITCILNKLGITDISRFIKRIKTSTDEIFLKEELLNLYHNQTKELKKICEKIDNRQKYRDLFDNKETGTEENYLYETVYNRLHTVNLYQTVNELNCHPLRGYNYISHNELNLSEQYENVLHMKLARVKEEFINRNYKVGFGYGNLYEMEMLRDKEITKEAVISGILEAAIFQLIKSYAISRVYRHQKSKSHWYQIGYEICNTIRNTMDRYCYYHQNHIVDVSNSIQDWTEKRNNMYRYEAQLLSELNKTENIFKLGMTDSWNMDSSKTTTVWDIGGNPEEVLSDTDRNGIEVLPDTGGREAITQRDIERNQTETLQEIKRQETILLQDIEQYKTTTLQEIERGKTAVLTDAGQNRHLSLENTGVKETVLRQNTEHNLILTEQGKREENRREDKNKSTELTQSIVSKLDAINKHNLDIVQGVKRIENDTLMHSHYQTDMEITRKEILQHLGRREDESIETMYEDEYVTDTAGKEKNKRLENKSIYEKMTEIYEEMSRLVEIQRLYNFIGSERIIHKTEKSNNAERNNNTERVINEIHTLIKNISLPENRQSKPDTLYLLQDLFENNRFLKAVNEIVNNNLYLKTDDNIQADNKNSIDTDRKAEYMKNKKNAGLNDRHISLSYSAESDKADREDKNGQIIQMGKLPETIKNPMSAKGIREIIRQIEEKKDLDVLRSKEIFNTPDSEETKKERTVSEEEVEKQIRNALETGGIETGMNAPETGKKTENIYVPDTGKSGIAQDETESKKLKEIIRNIESEVQGATGNKKKNGIEEKQSTQNPEKEKFLSTWNPEEHRNMSDIQNTEEQENVWNKQNAEGQENVWNKQNTEGQENVWNKQNTEGQEGELNILDAEEQTSINMEEQIQLNKIIRTDGLRSMKELTRVEEKNSGYLNGKEGEINAAYQEILNELQISTAATGDDLFNHNQNHSHINRTVKEDNHTDTKMQIVYKTIEDTKNDSETYQGKHINTDVKNYAEKSVNREEINLQNRIIRTNPDNRTLTATGVKNDRKVNEMIQENIQKQVNSITEQVYKKIEKKLQNERKRRGL